MLCQIFKREIPNNILFDLLEKICLKTDNYYFIDMAAYNKMLFLELKQPFIDSLMEYYYLSKRFYLERPFTYNSFTNIVRQICKHGNILFNSEIKYSHSNYCIHFFIYFYGEPTVKAPKGRRLSDAKRPFPYDPSLNYVTFLTYVIFFLIS